MDQVSRIRQLDTGVINKIAAGEVIERPASVVKELLDNSLDALATRIEVDIAEGGAELIRVVDDGEGIHPDDLLLAVTSHATSKISGADDLFRVSTMGFRGEALASIAEVSQMRLRTRCPNRDEGAELTVNAGKYASPTPCGAPVGTLIEVRQLFINTPVRRKFLKTPATEFAHITEQFTRAAIANSRLHLTLRHNGRTVYELPATTDLRERLQMFSGGELTDKLIPVESETDGIRLWGFVGHPSQSKSSRKGQYLFLNGRCIQDRALQHALSEAYRGLLMVGRQPIAFLFLEIPPDLVDVNVHPTKCEVRFRDGQSLYRQLLSTLRTRFLGMNLDSNMKLARGNSDGNGSLKPPTDPQKQRELQLELASWAKQQLAAKVEQAQQGLLEEPGSADDAAPSTTAWLPHPGSRANERSDSPVADSDANYPNENLPAEMTAPPIAMSAEAGEIPTSGFAPFGRVMQVMNCYLVAETDEGLAVIDQHALHERIMYEYLRERVLADSVESQRLLLPLTIELSPAEAGLLVEHADVLKQLGFGVSEFGGNTVLVDRYPAMLADADLERIIRDIADQLATSNKAPTRRDLLDSLLHMMSCKAAIKAGQRLTPEEMDSLLARRHLIDDAHHCPHGRPTALLLSRQELDRQFGRLG